MSYYDGILPIYQLLQDFATLHGAKCRGSGALLRGDMRRPSVCTCEAGGTGCSLFFWSQYCHFYRFIIDSFWKFWFWHNLWIRMNLHHESVMNLSLVEMPNSPKLQESEDLDKPVRCACVMCLRTPQKKNMDFQQERWFAGILQDYGEKTTGPCSQPGTIALIRVSSGSELPDLTWWTGVSLVALTCNVHMYV